jgi:AcrR family transcriptional regulator
MDINEKPRTVAGDEPRMRADARRSRAKLLDAATVAFAESGADAPLEDIARRAGVGIGTLYRHFPTRTDLQAGVFRSQVDAVCAAADGLAGALSPEQAFAGCVRAIAGYLITKRGLSKALVDSLGRDSELISLCSQRMRDTVNVLLDDAQAVGVVRGDVSAQDVLRLVHGVVMATEPTPHDTDRLLGLMLDGLMPGRPQAQEATVQAQETTVAPGTR